jgi:hypothetical protein
MDRLWIGIERECKRELVREKRRGDWLGMET